MVVLGRKFEVRGWFDVRCSRFGVVYRYMGLKLEVGGAVTERRRAQRSSGLGFEI